MFYGGQAYSHYLIHCLKPDVRDSIRIESLNPPTGGFDVDCGTLSLMLVLCVWSICYCQCSELGGRDKWRGELGLISQLQAGELSLEFAQVCSQLCTSELW